MQEASVLWLKAIFPWSIAPAGLRLSPHRQFRSTFPATSVTSPLISTVTEETEILQRWETDDADRKENEESQERGWAWRRNGRRGSGQTLGTYWGSMCTLGEGIAISRLVGIRQARQREDRLKSWGWGQEKKDVMNHLEGRTVSQHLGKY